MNMNTYNSSLHGEIKEDERKAAIKEWGAKYKTQTKDDDKIENYTVEHTGIFRNFLNLFSRNP